LLTTADAEYINRENSSEIASNDNGLNLGSIRNDFSQSVIIGVGLSRRFNYNYVFIDARYKIGLNNRLIREAQNDFENNEDINIYTLEYLQQDNDFRQNELTFTVGYIWPKYFPRKRRSLRAKSFLGNIFKKETDE
jgi:hypothetical protein